MRSCPAKEYFASLNFSNALRQETHNRFTGERLAAARFSHETEYFSLAEVESDALGGEEAVVVGLNLYGKLSNTEDGGWCDFAQGTHCTSLGSGALECVCGDIKCQDQDKHRNRGTACCLKETVYEFGARLVDHRAPAEFSLNAKSEVRQDNFAFNCRDED